MKVANCGHDEHGRYSGGTPGDQLGDEWNIRDYYIPSYGWSYHFGWKDSKLGSQYAELAKESANNNHIGYCQTHRSTFEKELKKAKWKPFDIAVDCEADCSSGVIALIHAIGYLNNITELKNFSATYTGDLYNALNKCSYFKKVTEFSLGDINLTPYEHTNIIVEVDGKKINTNRKQSASYRDTKLSGTYYATTELYMRYGAGTRFNIMKTLKKNEKVTCYGYYNVVNGTKWYYVVDSNNNDGFVSSKFLRRA